MASLTKSAFKKDMSVPMADAYNPMAVEAGWGAFWEHEGHMSADAADVLAEPEGEETESFVIVIPPPNVTGSLHLGHALTTAIEDCLTRWHRMLGHHTLWVPGTDHAGIATQSTVEKMLAKKEGITRHDLGREAFIKRVWEWKEMYGARITEQLRRLGGSVDWSREAFTMDAQLSKAVKEFFVTQHEKGIIYRENRLVNWCCKLNTALSDVEVEHVTITKRTLLPDPNGPLDKIPGHDGVKCYEFGVLVNFAYKVQGSDQEIIVATTRIETMLGDTAIAVHPKDPRYAALVGKCVVHPFFPERKITIVTDGELVDMALGSGAVKITPAHDPKDFQCGKRNKLQFISIFTEAGKVNHNGGEFEGMMRYDARIAVKAKLDELGLLRGQEDNEMQIPICSRSGDIIEPMLKPQWWVNCKAAAKKATDAVRNGDLELIPHGLHNHTWFNWLDNIQDWCISRQLWWGHRIPAYLVEIAGQDPLDAMANDSWVSGRDEEEAMAKAVARFKVDKSKITLKQDPDVLDTWFSSALFPFSVFGWPDKTDDLKAFYPTQLLETGHDILFFWVARMVMAGFMCTDKLPFNKVYLHAMVRDAHGRKMSKSLGNVLDPIDVMEGITLEKLQAKLHQGNIKEEEIAIATEGQKKDYPDGIPECGADALRFGLLAYTVQGRDVNLNVNKVAAYRRMCNKIWQATKFALLALGPDFVPDPLFTEQQAHQLPFVDKWILSRLNAQIKGCNKALKAYAFGTCVEEIIQFWKKDDSSGCFCDNYIEMIKPIMRLDDGAATKAQLLRKNQMRNVVWTCVEVSLRLLHPLMPFLTEELYHRLPRTQGSELIESRQFSIMVAPYPQPVFAWDCEEVDQQMGVIQKLFSKVRTMRASYNLTRQRPRLCVKTGVHAALLADQTALLLNMAQCGELEVVGAGGKTPSGWAVSFESDCELAMEPPAIDYAKEKAKLEKDLGPKLKSLHTLHQKMGILLDLDERSLKKMAKNEKKLKQACEKYGIAAGSVAEMNKVLGGLLATQTKEGGSSQDAAYVAALAAMAAAIKAKMPQKVMDANQAKLAKLDREVAALSEGIATAVSKLGSK